MNGTSRLHGLADAAAALAGELGLEAVLDTILQQVATVTGARYAALGVLGEDQTLSRFLTYGASQETVDAIGHYPTGKGVLGVLIRDPRVIRLDDIREHPAAYGFPPNHPEMTSFLGAPVRSRGQVYGNLYLTEKPGGFDSEDEQILLVLAAQAGAAIENALLSERLQSVAVQDERDRISRELHDNVIQTLFSIGMTLESTRGLVGTAPERVEDRIDGAVDGLDDAIRQLRSAIFHLRPGHAASMGFSRGLVELAREHEANALARPLLDVPGDADARVPEGAVPDLLAIAREALANVRKHARAREVEVRARFSPDGRQLVLEICDDGDGFDPDGGHAGRGLDNMAERVANLDAGLIVDSAPGKGTTVRVVLELANAGSRSAAAP